MWILAKTLSNNDKSLDIYSLWLEYQIIPECILIDHADKPGVQMQVDFVVDLPQGWALHGQIMEKFLGKHEFDTVHSLEHLMANVCHVDDVESEMVWGDSMQGLG